MAAKKMKKKVGDDVGVTPSGRNVTVGGKVLDPTTGTPFVKGKPHDNPKPQGIIAAMTENRARAYKPPAPPKAKPKAPPSKMVGFSSRKGMLSEIMNDRTMKGGKRG